MEIETTSSGLEWTAQTVGHSHRALPMIVGTIRQRPDARILRIPSKHRQFLRVASFLLLGRRVGDGASSSYRMWWRAASMANRRVVITGLGIVAPNGIGKQQFWRNLIDGKSAVDRVFAFDASDLPSQVAAEVRDFSATDFVSARRAKTMGRFSQFAVAAARLALDDAKLAVTPQLSDRLAVAYGTSLAGIGDLGTEMIRAFGNYGVRGIPATNVIEYPA